MYGEVVATVLHLIPREDLHGYCCNTPVLRVGELRTAVLPSTEVVIRGLEGPRPCLIVTCLVQTLCS